MSTDRTTIPKLFLSPAESELWRTVYAAFLMPNERRSDGTAIERAACEHADQAVASFRERVPAPPPQGRVRAAVLG